MIADSYSEDYNTTPECLSNPNALVNIIYSTNTKEEKEPYLCPVCWGRGSVPSLFYCSEHGGGFTDGNPETCRTCEGKGIVWG